MTSMMPSGTPTHSGRPARKCTDSTETAMLNSSDPLKPSQDFLGLIAGTIGCLPNSTPAV